MDEAAFRTYIAEFNAANFDALARCYADDVVFSFNGGLTLAGRFTNIRVGRYGD